MFGFFTVTFTFCYHLISSYEPAVEGPRDILSRGLRVFLSNSTTMVNILLQSSDPDVARVYREAVLARGGVVEYLKDRALVEREVAGGRAAAVWVRRVQNWDGHRFHYSREALFLEHTTFAYSKGHWSMVSRASWIERGNSAV